MIIPRYFDGNMFCSILNTIRIQRVETMNKIKEEITKLEGKENDKTITKQERHRLNILNEQKKTIFHDILKEIFNVQISPIIRNSNVSYKEVYQLIGSLLQINRAKKDEIQKITEWVNKDLHGDLEMDSYEEEILLIMDDLIHQFFTVPGTGNEPNEGEKKEFGQQAWDVFLKNHKEEINH